VTQKSELIIGLSDIEIQKVARRIASNRTRVMPQDPPVSG